MFTTTHACASFAKRNLRKFISISCFAFVFIANMNVSPANGRLLTSLTGAELNISYNNYGYQNVENECGMFNYLQRVTINGETVMVLTEFLYPAGNHQMTLIGSCDGLNLYEAGTCSCLETPDIKLETFPIKELRTATDQELEKLPNEIFNTESTLLLAGSKPGELWIRKNK